MRKIQEPVDGCIMFLIHHDPELRPFQSILIFADRIEIEEYLFNRRVVNYFNNSESDRMINYFRQLYEKMTDNEGGTKWYGISDQCSIFVKCWIMDKYNRNEVMIENLESQFFTKEDPHTGEHYLKEIKEFLNLYFTEHNIKVMLTPNDVLDFFE